MILLDLQLPDINGGEVLRQLKSSPKTRDIPVAIITSLDVDAEARMALSRQGAAVLAKSEVSSDVLRELMLGLGAALRVAEA
jgi:CheY-like chemotaxis protein